MINLVEFTFDSIGHLKELSFSRKNIKSDLRIIARAALAILLLPIAAPMALFRVKKSIDHNPKICIVSYNILVPHWASQQKPCLANESWQSRCERLTSRMAEENPDIIALQEVERFQDVQKQMKRLGYQGIFSSRNNGEEEGCAIFYKKGRVKVRSNETLFFNDGTGRLAQKVTFKNQQNQEFVLFNTHILYHSNEELQNAEVKKVLNAVQNETKPSIVCGDFNLTPQKMSIQLLKNNGLVDTLEHEKEGSFFMEGDDATGRRIDYIFTSENISVITSKVLGKAALLPSSKEPSDHLPIMAELEL